MTWQLAPRTDRKICFWCLAQVNIKVRQKAELLYIKIRVCFSQAFPGHLFRSNCNFLGGKKNTQGQSIKWICLSYKLRQTNFIGRCIKGHTSTSKTLPEVASRLWKLALELCLKIQKENPKDSAFSQRVAYSKRSYTTLRHLQSWVRRVSQKILSHLSHLLSWIYSSQVITSFWDCIFDQCHPQACH